MPRPAARGWSFTASRPHTGCHSGPAAARLTSRVVTQTLRRADVGAVPSCRRKALSSSHGPGGDGSVAVRGGERRQRGVAGGGATGDDHEACSEAHAPVIAGPPF